MQHRAGHALNLFLADRVCLDDGGSVLDRTATSAIFERNAAAMGFKIEGYPMPARTASLDATDRTDTVLGLDGEVVELSFLLPDWQANALEAVAHGRGLTTGQMLRDILGEFFQRFAGPGPANRISSLP